MNFLRSPNKFPSLHVAAISPDYRHDDGPITVHDPKVALPIFQKRVTEYIRNAYEYVVFVYFYECLHVIIFSL
jgi:hypothetical protein